jgi:hypothetical protein
MRITRNQLRRVIREELTRHLFEQEGGAGASTEQAEKFIVALAGDVSSGFRVARWEAMIMKSTEGEYTVDVKLVDPETGAPGGQGPNTEALASAIEGILLGDLDLAATHRPIALQAGYQGGAAGIGDWLAAAVPTAPSFLSVERGKERTADPVAWAQKKAGARQAMPNLPDEIDIP